VSWRVVDCSARAGRRLHFDTLRWAAALSNGTLRAATSIPGRKNLA
jgi:hypothetical protein